METKKKILVVEDDPLIALDICSALETFGYTVCGTVDTGEKARAGATEWLPDLILMDIRLKGKMDGIEAAQLIASECRIPIVFLTVDADESTLQRAKLVMPYGYLIKPFDPQELRSTIEITLHRVGNPTDSQDSLYSLTGTPASGTTFGEPERGGSFQPGERSMRAEILAKLPLFQGLSVRDCNAFAELTVERRFDAGEYIISEGSQSDGGFVVVSGRISITKSSLEGKELTVCSLAPGSTFGLLYTIKSFSSSSAARCQIESRVLWIPAHVFERLRADHPKVAQKFAEELSLAVALSHQLSSSLAHSKVERRLASALVTLLSDFGRGGGSDGSFRRLYMTRRELADLIGTTPETAIRVTKALERSGVLDLTRPGIIKVLDFERLTDPDLFP